MIEIIKAKGLNISKRSHLKVLFKELYSFFHSFGELRKTACPSFLSVMKEIENEETKKANTIENKEPNIYREDDFLLENFNDLVDLIEPQSYDKEIHEKELIRLIKELDKKRKEEMTFINEQKNKEKLILNDESSHEEFIKSEIKKNKSMSNNSFKMLLWIMRNKKEIEYENKLFDHSINVDYEDLIQGDELTIEKEYNSQWKTLSIDLID